MLSTAAAVGSPSVLILPLSREFGWSTTSISSALSVRMALLGMVGLLAAPLLNTLGLKRFLLSALLLVGAGLLISLAMTQVWHLVLLWGVLVGIGAGMTTLVLGATVAARWFSQRRGLVVGVLAASASAGPFLASPALSALAEVAGWRSTVLTLTGLIALSGAAVFALVPDHPDNTMHGAAGRPNRAGLAAPVEELLGALREAAGSGVFWVLLGTFAICGTSTSGLVQTHFVPFCADAGLSPLGSANVLALMGPLTILGSLAAGWLSDRFDSGWLLFWFFALRGLSLACLAFTEASLLELSLFGIFYGLDWVATVPPMVKIVIARFGVARANLVLGWISAGHQFAAAAAAYGTGLSKDGLSSYLPALLAAGALCLVAAAATPILSVGDGGRRS